MQTPAQIHHAQTALSNCLKKGTVAQVDIARARVRVQCGQILTDWLPWFERRVAKVITWSPLEVGEQCMILAPDGELTNAVVMAGWYSDQYPQPQSTADTVYIKTPDNAVFVYNHKTHQLDITLPSGASTTLVSEQVKIDANDTHFTGNVKIDGMAHVVKHIACDGSGGGTSNFGGSVHSNGDITAGAGDNPVSLQNHKHRGVQPGGGTSGEPVK